MDHPRTQTIGLTTHPGWIPSLEKSELTPTQDFVFIGTYYRTDLGLIFPPVAWFREAASHARRFLLGLSRRHQIVGTEWSLHPNIVRQMFSIWFIPELDLFATRHNSKLLTTFVSSVPDPQIVAVYALPIPWDRHWVYAYPPTALMQRVHHQLVHTDQCPMRLVVQLQKYQPWLPVLLRLPVDFPREVPPLPQLLRQPQSGVFHSRPEQVRLFAWSFSSVACERDSFL